MVSKLTPSTLMHWRIREKVWKLLHLRATTSPIFEAHLSSGRLWNKLEFSESKCCHTRHQCSKTEIMSLSVSVAHVSQSTPAAETRVHAFFCRWLWSRAVYQVDIPSCTHPHIHRCFDLETSPQTISGLMFADDSVEISATPERLQNQIRETLKYTRR